MKRYTSEIEILKLADEVGGFHDNLEACRSQGLANGSYLKSKCNCRWPQYFDWCDYKRPQIRIETTEDKIMWSYGLSKALVNCYTQYLSARMHIENVNVMVNACTPGLYVKP